MKKILKAAGIIIVIIIIAGAVFVSMYQPPKYTDFGVFANLSSQVMQQLSEHNAQERPVMEKLKSLTLNLAFPYSKMFGSSIIGVPVRTYETDRMAAVTISQFEIPPASGYCRDFTLNIRPRYEYRAPVFHIDFMKPSPGVPGLCSLDFFNVDKDGIVFETFLGAEMETVKKALALVEPYQRTVEQGRGKITKYLDPYKSPFRVELQEPKTKDENVRKKYYETTEAAVKLLLSAYLKSLDRAAQDPAYAQTHENKMKELVLAIYTNDFAVNIGKKIFKEHFTAYWLDGFWNVQVQLPE
jgi:hypothetical protein